LVDAQGSDPKVLVDRLSEVPLEEAEAMSDAGGALSGGGDYGLSDDFPLGEDEDVVSVSAPQEMRRVAEQLLPYPGRAVPPVAQPAAPAESPATWNEPDGTGDLMPPEEPSDWGFGEQPPARPTSTPVPPNAPQPRAEAQSPQPSTPPVAAPRLANPAPGVQVTPRDERTPQLGVDELRSSLAMPAAPFYTSPLLQNAALESSEPRMITVLMRSTNDRDRDMRRLLRAHGILISFPGHDRFAFQIYEGSRYYQLEFPSSTTGITPLLVQKLVVAVGEENVRIDPIRIH